MGNNSTTYLCLEEKQTAAKVFSMKYFIDFFCKKVIFLLSYVAFIYVVGDVVVLKCFIFIAWLGQIVWPSTFITNQVGQKYLW